MPEPKPQSSTDSVAASDSIGQLPPAPKEIPRNQGLSAPEKSIRVVVAHFNEGLQWLQAVPADYAITVSYAGEPPKVSTELPNSIVLEQTPNGGKDCGQWVRWIARHYDDLDDVVLFLQGSPYTGHTPEILLNLSRNKLTNIFDYFCSGRPLHKSVGKGWQFGELTWIVPSEYHTEPFSCGVWGSQHYVTKSVIRRRPKSFYERLARISLELGGSRFGDICEYYFSVIYGVEMEEVK